MTRLCSIKLECQLQFWPNPLHKGGNQAHTDLSSNNHPVNKLYRSQSFPCWMAPLFTCSLLVLLGGAFYVSLTQTLDQMTQRDCRLGVQAACEQLNK